MGKYDGMSDAKLREYYAARAHAMQSGVATMQTYDPKGTEPKHLRVGINAAMADSGGLVALLIAKGVFTEREYLESIVESMEREVATYEDEITKIVGKKVILA